MASSLLLAGFDVLDITSPVTLSTLDRGAPVPSVAEIQSTVLDGAVVSGLAAGNRTPQFTLTVRGTSRLNLAATVNQVLQYVDQQTWSMTFTPDGGMPVTFDCYRATVAIASTLVEDAQLTQDLTIQCEALPYGKSQSAQSLTLMGYSVAVIDDFTSMPTVTPSPWNFDASIATNYFYNGTSSLLFTTPYTGNAPRITVARSGLSVAASNGISSVTLMVYSTLFSSYWLPPQQWSLTLTVGGIHYPATAVLDPPYEIWTPVTFTFAIPIPAGTITAYSFTMPEFRTGREFALDYLIANPVTAARSTSTWGDEFILPTVYGSARAPMNIQLTPSSGTIAQFVVHAPPADTPDSQCLFTINAIPPPSSVTTPPGVRYGGTYSIWASFKAASSLTVGNVITITVSQGSASVAFTHVVTADEHSVGTQHVLLHFGEVALPLIGTPTQNYQTITFTVSGGLSVNDRIGDILVLDTRGQTVISDIHTPASTAVFVNDPPPGAAFGAVYSSPANGDLSDAVSIAPNLITGSPLWLYPPGNTRLLVWVSAAAPTAVLTYFPRWLQEATA